MSRQLRRGIAVADAWARRTVPVVFIAFERNPARRFDAFELYCSQLMRRYRPEPYSGPLLVLRAEGSNGHGALGWENYVTGTLDVVQIPGDHLSILRSPDVEELAAALDECVRLSGQ